MTLETISQMSDDPLIGLPAVALISPAHAGNCGDKAVSYTTPWDTILHTTSFMKFLD
ncbi:hypothetical protein X772_33650 [Mesorhizobium sp. LSJC280B00]|nr:hypothetical protein X772_33650 [Mesorhizobium sp. LSJC280B00]